MTAEQRPIRDILADCLRRERLGLIRPLWADWWEEAREPIRKRADHLARLLADEGLAIVRVGDPTPQPSPTSPVILSCPIAGDPSTERAIRKDDGDLWSIVTTKNGETTLEQSFSLVVAMVQAGLVLADDPEAKAIPGLGKRLAAAAEIYRLNAAGMGEP